MPFDAGTIVINSLVAHKVPHRRASDPTIDIPLSQALPPLPQPTLTFFRERLIRTLTSKGQDVEPDPNRPAPVISPLVTSHLTGELDLLPLSQEAARHLYASQGGSSSVGLLVACGLTLAGGPGVALMKLEEEKGVIVEDEIVDGQPTLSVTIEEHLLLTDGTRVFKAGVFWQDGVNLVGHVSDEQHAQSEIADYFLGTFLGCRLAKRPAVLTRDFYEIVTDFISSQVADPEKKLRYQQALHTEISSHKHEIDPTQFVQEHFDTEHRQPMINSLLDSGVPEQAFPKDISNLGSRPTTSRLRTASGITIAGSTDEIGERVRSTVVDNERVIVIHDTLTEVR